MKPGQAFAIGIAQPVRLIGNPPTQSFELIRKGRDGVGGGQDTKHVIAAFKTFSVAGKVLIRRRRLNCRQFLEPQALMMCDRPACFKRLTPCRVADQHLDPVVGGRKRQRYLGNHAVSAKGMRCRVNRVTSEINTAGSLLHGDNSQMEDVARFTEHAPADRAHSAGAAGDESADRGGLHR